MNTVFEPSCLFISHIEWQDEIKRNDFLEHLLSNLTNITEYGMVKIYWTDKLQELLWNYPQFPPWRLDKDWSNPLVPIIYKKLNQIIELIDSNQSLPACLVQPNLSHQSLGEIIFSAFLELMHMVIDINEPAVYMCLGVNQINQEYVFLCECHTLRLVPIIVAEPLDWLKYIDLGETYWLNSLEDIDKIRKALNIIFQLNKTEPIYEYEFSQSLLKDLLKVINHRIDILNSIAKRLVMTKQQAAQDNHLKDEYIQQRKEYRFRVTPRPYSTRIHYKYVKNKIIFLKYYDEGEHDDGLYHGSAH